MSDLTQKPSKSIRIEGKLLDFSSPIVMGIVNLTNNSFYAGSRINNSKDLLKRFEQILLQGGKIIDIGACSTRPGAKPIAEETEIKKLKNALILGKKQFPEALFSIDTYRSKVVEEVTSSCGEFIVNDISGGTLDDRMFETIARYNVPYILMHIQGTPENMQHAPKYNDVVNDLLLWFSARLQKLKNMGVSDIIIDPGFGFGKTIEHNYELLKRLNDFQIAGHPILAGLSRKSMIYKHLGNTPDDALNGTTALNAIALMKGADILRVHDVHEAKETIDLFLKMMKS